MDGDVMEILMVPVVQFTEMRDAAKDGDERAAMVLVAFMTWSEQVEKAKTLDMKPACVACNDEVTPDNLGGFVVIKPLEPGKKGFSAGACARCVNSKSHEQLTASIKQSIREQLDAEVEDVQLH